MNRFRWSWEENEAADLAKRLGFILIRDALQQYYTVYDNPDFIGAFTSSNELIWSRDLNEINNFLNEEKEKQSTPCTC